MQDNKDNLIEAIQANPGLGDFQPEVPSASTTAELQAALKAALLEITAEQSKTRDYSDAELKGETTPREKRYWEKSWNELTVEEKLERCREQIKVVERLARQAMETAHKALGIAESHDHLSGKAVQNVRSSADEPRAWGYTINSLEKDSTKMESEYF